MVVATWWFPNLVTVSTHMGWHFPVKNIFSYIFLPPSLSLLLLFSPFSFHFWGVSFSIYGFYHLGSMGNNPLPVLFFCMLTLSRILPAGTSSNQPVPCSFFFSLLVLLRLWVLCFLAKKDTSDLSQTFLTWGLIQPFLQGTRGNSFLYKECYLEFQIEMLGVLTATGMSLLLGPFNEQNYEIFFFYLILWELIRRCR